MKRIAPLCIALASLLAAGCSSVPAPAQRKQLADALAARHGWIGERIPAGPFTLAAYRPRAPVAAPRLTVYIEGDGFAWVGAAQPSLDPTPRDPLALRLALAQPSGNAVYLARPCQFVDAEASHCDRRFWTGARFSAAAVAASDQAITALKREFGAGHVTLVGYSGGAAIALLVAARRGDVERVITVAGNVDPDAWTRYHHLAPLDDSQNPITYRAVLNRLPQRHLAGAADSVVPPALIQAFAAGMAQARVEVLPGYDHHCCWAEHWPQLWGTLQ